MTCPPIPRYSQDIDYEYRQDSDLLYLTGVTQAMLWFQAWEPAAATNVVAAACLFSIAVQLRSRR